MDNVGTTGGFAWLLRPGIGRRIALAMVLSLVAVQLQAFVQIWLLAKPEIRLAGTRWLAETTRDAAEAAFQAPPDERGQVLRGLSRDGHVQLVWQATQPWIGADRSKEPVLLRFVATLRELLGGTAQRIEITTSNLDYLFPIRSVRVVVSPPEIADKLGSAPVGATDPEILIPATMRIAVQGIDGTWVGVSPVGFKDTGPLAGKPITPLLVAGIIIVVVSIVTARRIMAPLDRLVIAADRIGMARDFVPVASEGLAEFATVARAFETIQRRLLRFVEDRTQMLAAMSHDLRSALTRMRLAAETCGVPEERAAVLEEINDMKAMVESTLAFASGEARLAPQQPTDIAALLISLADDAADAGMACTYHGPDHAEAIGNPTALKRAMWNLIDNALKYGGCARIRLAAESGVVRVSIQDEGPGIAPELVEEAFRPFRRLDPARSGKLPGAGLGLTIARDVVLSHGGTIEVRTAAAGGMVVDVTLPER